MNAAIRLSLRIVKVSALFALSISFTVGAAVLTPTVSSVSPSPVPASNSDQAITIYGSNFQSGVTLTFHDTLGDTYPSVASKLTFVSSGQLTYQFNDNSDAGTWTVSATNPGSSPSGTINFTVGAAVLTPTVSSVSPSPVPGSTSDQAITIYGSNFQSGVTLTFHDTLGDTYPSVASKLTFVSSGQLTYQFNDNSDAGTWTVSATNPGSSPSGTINFTVGAAVLTPTVSSVSPSPVPGSTSDQAITIYGSNFQSGVTLTFHDTLGDTYPSVASKLTFVSSGQLTYQFNDNSDAGTWTVSATNPGSSPSGTINFTVGAAVLTPTVSSVSPSPVPGSTSDQAITIYGSNFQSGVTLTFHDTLGDTYPSVASKLTFVSSGQLTYQFNDNSDAGTWTVSATNPGSSPSGTINFTVGAAVLTPTVSSVSPSPITADPSDNPQTLTITGSNFVNAPIVSVTGPGLSKILSASEVSYVNATTLTMTIQLGEASGAGSWSVIVTNPNGQSSGTVYFMVDAPTQSGISASSEGVDYSDSHPDPIELKAAGYSFVVRYVSGEGAPKDLTANEAQALQSAGLEIIVVFETTANRMQGGGPAGIADANTAVAVATAAGAPQSFFCYFACDFDAQPSDQTAINAYLDGAASVLGGVSRVGFYGGYGPLKQVLDAGKAAKGWQTEAWSGTNVDPRISLYQNADEVSMFGGEFDIDDAYGTDLGQWSVSDATGSIQVNLAPAGAVNAGAQWRVDGGAWQNSGAIFTGLSVGLHSVSFGTVTGWAAPDTLTEKISANQETVATGTYVAGGASSATHFSINAPASATAGSVISMTVVALDASNNNVSDYAGTVLFTSSDSAAHLPANGTLTNGTESFLVTLDTVGAQTIAATDSKNSSITGASTLTIKPSSGDGAPSITIPPVTQTVTAGQSVTFSVTASGTPPPTYQWYFNGMAISSATNSSFTITSVEPINSGSYIVVVTNTQNSVSSSPAMLTVNAPSGGPSVVTQPASQTVATGSTVVFGVTPSGVVQASSVDSSNKIRSQALADATASSSSATYQWYLDEAAITGATNSMLVVQATAASAGTYTCLVMNSNGSILSNPASLTVNGSTTNPGRLTNLSVNAVAGGPSQILTVGFYNNSAGATGSQTLLVQALGPTLYRLGVTGFMPDPQLNIFNSGQNIIGKNAGWGAPLSNQLAVIAADAATYATPLSDTGSKDSATVLSLAPGGYTIEVSSVSGVTGTTLAALYDDTPLGAYTTTTPHLINISCRLQLGAKGILTAGFTVGGNTAKTVIIRASGPALLSQGVTGVMPDPQLLVYDANQNVIASNAGWGGSPVISSIASSVYAQAFTDPNSNDSAVVLTLPPASYTVQADSVSGTAGDVMIEVFEVP